MEIQEYFTHLDKVHKDIIKKNYEIANQDLEWLFQIKPVRLRWFVEKAFLTLELTGDYDKAYEYLNTYEREWCIYPGMKEKMDMHIKFISSFGDELDKRRIQNTVYQMRKMNSENDEEEKAFLNNFKNRQDKLITNFFENEITYVLVRELQDSFFIQQDVVTFVLLDLFGQKLFNQPSRMRNWIPGIMNMGYFWEILQDEKEIPFIVIMEEKHDTAKCEMLANILDMLGKQVFLFDVPLEVEENISLVDTVEVSVDNIERLGNILLFHPIALVQNQTIIGDNRDLLIAYINSKLVNNGMSVALCTGSLMDDLCMRPMMSKKMEQLLDLQMDYYDSNMVFGWSGNYLSYISTIYGFDAEETINRPAECDFSIVIPARNSADSLKYTLQTCLELDYAGKYEIVVSDNSTNGNQEVYELIQELNNPRIKYYRTPRDLHLPKSFEYAYLKAKGEFIFALGSDDGILPESLTVLSKVLKEYPEEPILMWDRGFYAWPGFNGGQQNQFVIPRRYEKGKWNIKKVQSEDLLAGILKDPSMMYSLPMLYINSGFRRSYLKTLLEKTGRLWDGVCQDIYMGVINIAINKEILMLEYPLTIAGMTNSSVGRTSNEAITNMSDAQKELDENRKSSNVGGFSTSKTERLMPLLKSDVSSLYNCLLRAIARGVMPRMYLDYLFDWKKMFLECIALMSKKDIYYDKNVHYFRYTATKHGEEFLKWFDKSVYPVLMKPEVYSEDTKEQEEVRSYEVGYKENGSLVLDASEFGVENIYDAVQLFQEKMG